ncbi:hypothetical protein SAMN05421743_10411 [Thalassobacillus cyri]|uniref:Uncharacterized protein n=1 Tax=Thalassobacillus cyri TaxID=571932 RepID=A0A1H4A8S6_9BACI|nr:hypothetical protein SAMN05421743_10411 [Thalassobacillus cyri]
MFGLTPLMSFMMFVFWPAIIVAAMFWGRFAFRNERGLDE